MHFALTEEQAELASTVRSLLAKRSDPAAVRSATRQPKGYDEQLWRVLCEQVGAAALAIPEEYGGAGFSLFETHVVLEELGAALTPSPLLGSAVLAAQSVLLSGTTDARRALLPGIAAGTTVAALVWAGQEGAWSTEHVGVCADGTTLSGSGHYVLDAGSADVLLVLARTDEGIGLFQVEPSAYERSRAPGMDRTLGYATVGFDGVEGELLDSDAATWLPRLRDIACVAVTALQVGAMQRSLDLTVAYAQERVQFGRPIGSFQALKHRMADMLVDVETSRSASWAAAWSASQPTSGRHDDLAERAATAKAWCSEALSRVVGEAVQMHGGIAITWEHDIQLYFKRAHALSQLFGQPHQHRARLAGAWL